MIKHRIMWSTTFLLLACTSPGDGQTDFSNDKPTSDENDKPPPRPDDQSAGDAIAIEDKPKVTLPESLENLYFSCSNAQVSDAVAIIDCGLKSKASTRLVTPPLTSTYSVYSNTNVQSSIAPLNDLNRDLRYTITANSAEELTAALAGLKLLINMQDSGGNQFVAAASISTEPFHWQNLSTSNLPDSAFIGGSENMGSNTLYACQSEIADIGLLPGKMATHFANGNRVVCYTSFGTNTYRSLADDGATINHEMKGLLIANASGYLGWSPQVNAVPDNALPAGMTAGGAMLYSCRNSEAGPAPEGQPQNDPNGEPTPGLVDKNDSVCRHEYYGAKNSNEFSVLLWLGQCNQEFLINPPADLIARAPVSTCEPAAN